MDAHLFVVPVTCRRLYLSLEHPDRFLKELGRMPAEQPEAAKAA
jgi:hypothetical protein